MDKMEADNEFHDGCIVMSETKTQEIFAKMYYT